MTTVGRGSSVGENSKRTMAATVGGRVATRTRVGSRRIALALVLAGACTALTLALLVTPASAVIVRVQGRVLSYEPAPNAVSRPSIASPLNRSSTRGAGKANSNAALLYHPPGPVMPSNPNYPLHSHPPVPPP